MTTVEKPTEDFKIIGPMMAIMMAALMLAMFAPPVAAETAKLSGHVRDSEGNPVDEAQLSLDGLTYITEADGYYEFTDLTPGAFSLGVVNAEDLGYEYKPPISMNLVAGDNVKDIVLTTPVIPTKANLVGVVRNYTTLDLMDEVAITLNSHEAPTNIYGLYSFHDIEPGDYTLIASKEGFDTKTIGVTLDAGDNTQDIKLVPEGVPVAEFEVSDLSIVPTEIGVGGNAEISVVVTNVGDAAGSHIVACDATPATYTPIGVTQKQVTLDPGGSQRVSFIIAPYAEGEYTIWVDNLTGLLNVTSAPVAEFEVSDLSITPAVVNVGETVEISALVTNIGSTAGAYTVNCDITPATFTPLEVVPIIAVPWGDIISMMILMVFMSMIMNMIREE